MEATYSIRDKLIDEGIRMLHKYGVDKLSLRGIAQACGVSCAAPYKHFQNKQDFIKAVVDAINLEWFNKQTNALQKIKDDAGTKLKAICKEYLLFLRDHPHFCSIIVRKDESVGKWHINRLFDQSSTSKQLIRRYCEEKGLSSEEAYCKVYVIRALLYGSAIMNQQREMRLTDGVLEALYHAINACF